MLNRKKPMGTTEVAVELRLVAGLIEKEDDGTEMAHHACDGIIRRLTDDLIYWTDDSEWSSHRKPSP